MAKQIALAASECDCFLLVVKTQTDTSSILDCQAYGLDKHERRCGYAGAVPKHHPTPLSGGIRKALGKERAMTSIFAERSAEKRREGEALIREADNLSCQSWNERM
jgi:hypothetical protein